MVAAASAVVRAGPRRSDVHRARGAGPLRLLCPRAGGDAAWIVTSSFGGGLVDGDALALEVEIDAGATAVVTSQASTKIYKGTSSQRTAVRVRGDGRAIVVPDPVVPFRDARFAQVTTIALDAASSLVFGDVLTAGRIAYGERWSAAALDLTLALEVAGARVLHDRVVLGDDAARRMRRFEAIATAIVLGPAVREHAPAALALAAPAHPGARVVVAGSPLGDGGAMLRIAGERVEDVVAATRAALAPACARLGEDPWSRRW
jgi:urease accessory protein